MKSEGAPGSNLVICPGSWWSRKWDGRGASPETRRAREPCPRRPQDAYDASDHRGTRLSGLRCLRRQCGPEEGKLLDVLFIVTLVATADD